MTKTYQKIGKQIHWEIKIGWFRISHFRLRDKFAFKFEILKGWDK